MNHIFLSLALVAGSSLTPLCCWAKMEDVHLATDNLVLDLGSVEACLASGDVRTGSLRVGSLPAGWTITSVTLTAVIDGVETPPPVEIFTSTAGTSGINASGTSASLSGTVRDQLEAAVDSGKHHSIGTRITVNMKDDQGADQATSMTSNFDI